MDEFLELRRGALDLVVQHHVVELVRLRERATESSGEIQVRLDLARKQQTLKDRFDYVIVNEDVERAAEELTEIVRRELQTAGTMSRP